MRLPSPGWEEMTAHRMTPENVSAEGKRGLSLLFSGLRAGVGGGGHRAPLIQ